MNAAHRMFGRQHLKELDVGVIDNRPLTDSEAKETISRQSEWAPLVGVRTVKGDSDLEALFAKQRSESKSRNGRREKLVRQLRELGAPVNRGTDPAPGVARIASHVDVQTGQVVWRVDSMVDGKFGCTDGTGTIDPKALHDARLDRLAYWRGRLQYEIERYGHSMDMLDIKMRACQKERDSFIHQHNDDDDDDDDDEKKKTLADIECWVSARFITRIQMATLALRAQREELERAIVQSALDCAEFEFDQFEQLAVQQVRATLQAHWQKQIGKHIDPVQLKQEMSKIPDPSNPPPQYNRFKPLVTDPPPGFFQQYIPRTFDIRQQQQQHSLEPTS